MRRIWLAFVAFFLILFGRKLPESLRPMLPEPAPEPERKRLQQAEESPAPPPARPDPALGALLLLGLFQREGRLVDFLNESIEDYDDAAIGAAVRDIHRGCRKVLVEHFGIEPVVTAPENEAITLDEDFDPARIRLTGNVSARPPFRGTLRHHGWRAARVSLPLFADGMNAAIVAPAEVEL